MVNQSSVPATLPGGLSTSVLLLSVVSFLTGLLYLDISREGGMKLDPDFWLVVPKRNTINYVVYIYDYISIQSYQYIIYISIYIYI